MAEQRFVCLSCNVEFSRTTTRGRPPKFCPSCRQDPMKMKNANNAEPIKSTQFPDTVGYAERIDRLERNLKSRGLHISQHQEKGE